MHAKIMLLPASKLGEKLSQYAEAILTDVSAAFSHSFSLMQGKIGEKSLAAHQEALTDETVEACQKCQAVLLCDGDCEGAQELYDALDLPLRIRSFCVPDALCGRHESPVNLWGGHMFSVDADTLRRGMQSAFRFADEVGARLTSVSPSGASKAEWDAALRVQKAVIPGVACLALPAADAMTSLIEAPGRLGLLLCPPYAGGIFDAAAMALCPLPGLMHDAAFDESIGVYAPCIPAGMQPGDEINPFAVALAVAALLRFSLKLGREAGCVEAAVNNVLSAGWRTADIAAGGAPKASGQAIVELICEQISVAGELMSKGAMD